MARLAMAVVLAVVVQQSVAVAVTVAEAQVPQLPAAGPRSLLALVPVVKAAPLLVALPRAAPATSIGCPRSTA
ncbi:hypothetical protein SY91_01764 [Burkholderia cenocepacia]|uniref:hypothetical protein n=1 Tax=Burkholderia cenocepacia TaxID=95486 RepID=UPI00163CD824|nr:hypothetical protein [Burkholderia cenocepacia]QND94365.1 hypothetical protein SY91_01764 [Burkholderia cenocepacia]